MQNFIEIASIIKNVKLKSSDFLVTDKPNKTQPAVFYEKILKGEFRTDQDAAQFFFNESTNSSKYKNLKRYLREKLISTLFFVEPNKNYGDFNRAYLYCCKYMMAAKILMNLGARKSGIDLCQKVFNKALKVELSEFIVSSSRYLRLHYGARVGDLKKFEYFHQVHRDFSEAVVAENKSEEYYIDLMIPYVTSKAVKENTEQQANQSYHALVPYLERYKSPVLHFYANYIKVLSLLVNNNYTELIVCCKEAIRFFEKKDYVYITPLRVFYHNLLIGFTQLKDYQNGKEAAVKSMTYVLPGTHSWYVNKELQLMLAFHSKEYEEATLILMEAVKNSKFSALNPMLKERWLINSAYIHFLAYIGKIPPTEQKIGKFRLAKFLNSIPTFSKDKRGLNIPVLIVQILFMIVQKKYDEAIDRFEAIKKYSSRYVRKGDNYRSNCFLNMLLQVPACSFHKSGVLRTTKDWYERMKSNPLEIANQPHELEIIPYEDLWEFIIESLDVKFHKPSERMRKNQASRS